MEYKFKNSKHIIAYMLRCPKITSLSFRLFRSLRNHLKEKKNVTEEINWNLGYLGIF